MAEHAVVIVGAGPTGLMLAAELALAKVDVAVVERRLNQDLVGTRAGGLHARTLELLDQRGVVERFVSQGQKAQAVGFAWNQISISDLPTRHNYVLALTQKHIERILAEWVAELPVTAYREREVIGVKQTNAGVEVALSDGQTLQAQYLVGCDGGRSLVRKTAGIDFPGWDATGSWLIAEVEMTRPPEKWSLQRDELGIRSVGRMGNEGPVRVLVPEVRLGASGEPTLDDLKEALIAVYNTDYGVHSPTSLSRFTDMARQAATYRDRRVLLAGDAAHVHHPVGGQGLNTGVHDAVNLGWKLAQVTKQRSPESLLDTYHAERHPVGARVLRNTLAQVALLRRYDDRLKALDGTLADLLTIAEARQRIGAMQAGLDLHYALGDGHPLLGRRMPDLDLGASSGPTRVYSLLHEARPVLLSFAPLHSFDMAPWAVVVRYVEASFTGQIELPALGAVTRPSAVLIRPDGYVAWVGDGTSRGLNEALTTWCGRPAAV